MKLFAIIALGTFSLLSANYDNAGYNNTNAGYNNNNTRYDSNTGYNNNNMGYDNNGTGYSAGQNTNGQNYNQSSNMQNQGSRMNSYNNSGFSSEQNTPESAQWPKNESYSQNLQYMKDTKRNISFSDASTDANVNSDSTVKASSKTDNLDSAATAEDRKLNEKIRNKLSSWFSRGNGTIAFKTTNGNVTITGMVNKQEDVDKVGNRVKEIDGVMSVNNQLTTQK